MKVKLLDSFVSKLNEQVNFISKDKPQAARKFKNDILAIIKELPEMPFKYRKSIYFDSENIREIVFKSYKIVFIIEKKNSTILVIGLIKEEESL
jgi:plasmid stabilization system protein ParE